MDNILVQDVCEVYLKDLSNSTPYFFGITTKNDITQKIKQDMLKGGIGNGIVGVVQSEKEITFKVSTLLHNDSLYEIQSGASFTSSTVTVQKNEVLKCVSGKLTMTGTPKGSAVVVFDSKGKVTTGTYATGVVTLTGGVEGDYYTVVYPNDSTGNVLTLDSKKFPKNYYVELHTIAYDVNTNQVVADIFWTFNKALPNGGLQAQYEAGKSNGDDIEFTAQLLAGNSEYGTYVVVPRA
jgi:hypothetical protein